MMRIFRSENSKKGFTLVELCVVIALTAIVFSMVLAFVPLMVNKSNDLINRKSVAEDMQCIESMVNRFIMHFDSDDFTLQFSDGSSTIKAVVKTGTGRNVPVKSGASCAGELSFDSATGRLICKSNLIADGNDWDIEVKLTSAKKIAFSNQKDVPGKTDKLIACSIDYTVTSRKNGVKEYNKGMVFVTHSQGEILSRVVK